MSATPPPEGPWSGSGDQPPPPPPPGGYPPPPPGGYQPPPGGYPPPAAGGYQPSPGGYPAPPPSWQQPPGGGYGQPGVGYGPPGGGQPGGRLAGWWQRVGASVIDFLVILIPAIIVGGLTNHTSSDGSFHVNYAGGFLIDLIWIVYTGLMVGSGGQTVGNKAVHTHVVDGRTGGQPGMGRGFGRAVAQAVLLQLFVIPWILDSLWPLWDRDNQTLHDKIAGTIVLRDQY